MNDMAKLEVNHLTISFRTNNGAVRAVRDISFNLEAGETLAVAGESGSGKSVTARAVMGILAGNAMVEGGEIIYDGKDLLKIPEEEFHRLRGHRLAMVFQDPLSALNPIMRIGAQLTEAMILNNKERRADGKRRYNSMLSQLSGDMAACGSCGSESEIKVRVEKFRRLVDAGVKRQHAYDTASESAVGILDCLEEAELALLQDQVKNIPEIVKRIEKLAASDGGFDELLHGSRAGEFSGALEEIKDAGSHFSREDGERFKEACSRLKDVLTQATGQQEPDFFTFEEEKGLMDRFKSDIADAMAYSEKRSAQARVEALRKCREALPVFESRPMNTKACERAAKSAADAVKKSIDPLVLEKDNRIYVFESTLLAGIARYRTGLSSNPKEEKRFQKDTAKNEKLAAKGREALSVAPRNLVDLERVQDELCGTIRDLTAHFEEAEKEGNEAAGRQQTPDDVISYLIEAAKDEAYHLSAGMARHRAIDLMKEVGIPQPHRRFDQYPFEFSGGMRQRIVIAIALSANPDILICDEPTTALDVTIQAQILELIGKLKAKRNLSVIFITHDLGVVANVADKIAVMYAGKIVEYGTADEVFYDPKHPYTWALLSSMPDLETKEKLDAIPGTPPNMIVPPKGDAFAARNRYAMEIDLEQQPPVFHVTPTHWAATWLLHPNAPKVSPPAIVMERINRMKRQEAGEGGEKA